MNRRSRNLRELVSSQFVPVAIAGAVLFSCGMLTFAEQSIEFHTQLIAGFTVKSLYSESTLDPLGFPFISAAYDYPSDYAFLIRGLFANLVLAVVAGASTFFVFNSWYQNGYALQVSLHAVLAVVTALALFLGAYINIDNIDTMIVEIGLVRSHAPKHETFTYLFFLIGSACTLITIGAGIVRFGDLIVRRTK